MTAQAIPAVAALSLGAAAIHFSVIGGHYVEYPLFGLLFAALAWFQAGWALWFSLRPSRAAAFVALAVNAGAMVVWAASRTTGLPIGPQPWTPEPIGALDLAATGLEAALVLLLLWSPVSSSQPSRRTAATAPSSPLATVAGILVAAVVASSVIAVSGGGTHADHDHGVGHTTPAASSSPALLSHADETSPPAATSRARPSGSPSQPPPAPSPSREAPTAAPPGSSGTPPAQPGSIVFARDLDEAGRVTDPVHRFQPGEFAVWVVTLLRPPRAGTLEFAVAARLSDGREFPHWTQALPDVDPDALTIVSAGRLSDFAHGGTGTYVMRYVADGEVLAEGVFELRN